MNYQLEKATVEDLSILNEISFASKSFWNYPKEWLEHWREGLKISSETLDNQQVYKLVVDHEIAGFSVMDELESYYEVLHLWLHPKYIGKKLGSFLLKETLARVVVQPKDVVVEADPNAEAFYSKHGFVTFSKVESYPKGRFLPLMRKKG